jgi:hypothetical protein
VLDALGKTASEIRNKLGESLNTVQKFDTPLEHMHSWASRLPMTERTNNRFPLFMMTLVGGIFYVWLYAMIRSRFDSGPKTAALAGGIFWLLSWLFPVVLWSLGGPFPALPLRLLATHLTTYLGVAVVATVLGAWSYKEYDTQEPRVLQKV